MSGIGIHRGGPPETVLPPEAEEAEAGLAAAGDDKAAVAEIVAAHPGFLAGWARLGDLAGDPVEAYAYFRVGYHRGLDRLRQSGWRGSGYVRWRHETNRGFLSALEGLRMTAARIGEAEEERRCAEFLKMLDPDWPPS